MDLEAIKRAKLRSEERLQQTPIQLFTINGTSSSLSMIKENSNFNNIKTPTNIDDHHQIKKSSIPKSKLLTVSSTRNQIRTNSLNRITRSQPSSRSTSPSLRSAYLNDLTSPYSSDLSSIGSSKMKRSAIPVITPRQSLAATAIEDATAFSPLMNRSLIKLKDLSSNHFNGSSNSSVKNVFKLDCSQSDQSEVSSLCSDKSFGERRTLEDINDIIKNLNSTHWPNKKDGLYSLEHFIYHSPTNLNEDQIKLLADLFTKMLLDPNTKALSIVLNTLQTFIIHFNNELSFWLYILLTRLFLKTGSELLASIQKRIIKTFEVIADAFSKSTQFNVVIQFLSDTKLTPVLKVKITALQFLLNLILQMDPADLNCKQNKKEYEQFLIKIIQWTEDKKSAQLRSLSQDIILELFNLNTPEFCNLVSQLPAGYWDTAYKYMKEKKVSKKQVEDSVVFSQSFYDQMLKFSFTNNEDLNQTEYIDSLMKTTREISNFTSGLNSNHLDDSLKENNNKSKLMKSNDYYRNQEEEDYSTYKTSEIEHEKKANSMDSGISQIDDCKTSTSTNDSLSNKLSPEQRENIDNSSVVSDLTTYNSFKSMNSFYVTTTTTMKNYSQNEELNHSISPPSTNGQAEEITEINNNNLDKCLINLEELNLNDTKKKKKIKFEKKQFDQLIDRIENEQDIDCKLKSLEELDELILTNDLKKNLKSYTIKLIKLLIDQIENKELILRQLAIKTFSDLINEQRDCILDQQLEIILDKILFLTKQDYKEFKCVNSTFHRYCIN